MTKPVMLFQRRAGVDFSALPGQLENAVEQLALATASGDQAARLPLVGRVGELYYLLGDYQAAIPLLEEAVAGAQQLGARRLEVVNWIRLATTYQYAGRHDEAEPLFRRAIALARAAEGADRLDFALQHFGKCLVEMGRLDEAIACFEEALALRQAKGDAGLIASTEQALAAVRRNALENEEQNG
jgi:tetratricopeptide (TPR) repeat protein